MVKEVKVEEYLREQVEKHGGLCEKHTSPGRRGVPDRLVTWAGGVMHLIETKASKKKPRPDQVRDHKSRRVRGIIVFVIDTKRKVDIYIDYHEKPMGLIEHMLQYL